MAALVIIILDRNGNEIARRSTRKERHTNDRYLRTTYLRACPDCDILIELAQGTLPRAHPNCPVRLSAAS